MINVAVKQGWAGGKWHTRQFEQALKAAGYSITDELNADVVVAHSIACYDLKIKSPATYFILIDPPYWPGKSILSRFIEKQKQDNRNLKNRFGQKYLLQKIAWGIFYIFARPQYTLIALRGSGQLGFLDELAVKMCLSSAIAKISSARPISKSHSRPIQIFTTMSCPDSMTTIIRILSLI